VFVELERTELRLQLTTAAVLALTPLLILPAYSFYYDVTPKVVITLLGAALGLVLLLRDSTFSGVPPVWADPLGRRFCLLAAAQLVSLLLSTFFSSHAALSWNGGNWRRFGFISQCAVIVLAYPIAASRLESGLQILLRAGTASGVAIAIYGIFQYLGIDPLLPQAGYHIGEGVAAIVRPPSTLGHADYLAGYLLYVVFFGAALLATEPKPKWRALGAAGVVAGSVAVVLSGTRGALLGLAAGAIALWIWNRPRLTRKHAVVAVALCAVSLAFYFSPAGMKLRARGQWELEDLRGGARLLLWRDSLRMARQRSLLGFGPETFGLEFPRYQSVDLSRAYPDFYHESPHNIFLDALVSEGVPGLAILAGFAALACFAARRAAAQRNRAVPYLASALVAGLVAGVFVCFTLTGAIYFYATIAMLVGLAIPRTCVFSPKPLRIPALALSLSLIALFLYFTIRLTKSDFALAQAKRALDAGRIDDSITAFRLSERWHPAGSSDDLYFSRALVAAKTSPSSIQQAFLTAQRATGTSEERQNAWYNLAEFYATQNEAAAVEMCLRRSMEASPNWFKPHWALAQMLQRLGRHSEALAEAQRAVDLDGGKAPEISQFLQSITASSVRGGKSN
jgi:O-antigen ligase